MDGQGRRARALPQLRGRTFVTDGGIETDLFFNRGIDLREFAAFPLVEDPAGRRVLTSYFDEYAAIAADAGAGLLLETPTWRASSDWGARIGYTPDDLRRVNADAITLLKSLRDRYARDVGDIVVSGQVGPRDADQPDRRRDAADAGAAAEYHRPQLEVFAAEGADMACGMTIGTCAEAAGITLAAHDAGLPVTISFTVETDGRLPDGTRLGTAIAEVDAAAGPEYFMINCAHPSHIAAAFDEENGDWASRVLGVRYNASERSHAELDEAPDLDRGDLEVLAAGHARLAPRLPGLVVLGGCCGTDASHVRRLWRSAPPGTAGSRGSG